MLGSNDADREEELHKCPHAKSRLSPSHWLGGGCGGGGLVEGQSVLVMNAAEELKTGHLGAVHQPLPRSWEV